MTEKQKRFCDEYLIDLNATQAAIRAGYSSRSADKIGSQLLGKTRVQEKIRESQAELRERNGITQDSVVKELANIGFANCAGFVSVETKEGLVNGRVVYYNTVTIVETNKLTNEKQAALAGIKQGANGVEVKLHDKVRALELLGRHLGIFNDSIDINGKLNLVFDDDYGDE